MAPTLGYWTVRGLAQQIRLLLEYTGTKYEEKEYTFGPAPDFSKEEWLFVKDTLGLEFPNLPYYIDGDLKITESGAILRHLGRKNNLVGTTEEDKIRIDMAVGLLQDVGMEVVMLCYNQNFETAKVPYIADIDKPLQKLSKLLGSNDYITGSNLCIADFWFFELMERFFALSPDSLESYPNLVAFHKRFAELPAIKAYLASPAFQKIQTRFNGRSAKFGAGIY